MSKAISGVISVERSSGFVSESDRIAYLELRVYLVCGIWNEKQGGSLARVPACGYGDYWTVDNRSET